MIFFIRTKSVLFGRKEKGKMKDKCPNSQSDFRLYLSILCDVL